MDDFLRRVVERREAEQAAAKRARELALRKIADLRQAQQMREAELMEGMARVPASWEADFTPAPKAPPKDSFLKVFATTRPFHQCPTCGKRTRRGGLSSLCWRCAEKGATPPGTPSDSSGTPPTLR